MEWNVVGINWNPTLTPLNTGTLAVAARWIATWRTPSTRAYTLRSFLSLTRVQEASGEASYGVHLLKGFNHNSNLLNRSRREEIKVMFFS
jgi:hypothetical protein